MKNYVIEADKSEIRILVFKAGLFSAVAHNHVIAATKMVGEVQLDEDNFEQTSLEVIIPLESLILDDPERRKEEGEDFATKLTDYDLEETYKNLFGKKVLHIDKYPTVTVASATVGGSLSSPELKAEVTIHGVTNNLDLPCEVEVDEETLHAKGQIEIKQTDFGMKPFSQLLGSIKVKDKLMIKYDIYANA